MNISNSKIILSPESLPVGYTHAAYPIPLRLDKNRLRIFFCSRNSKQIGRVFFCDVDSSEPSNILHIEKKPVMYEGVEGTFDEHGISLGNIFRFKSRLFVSYMGWSKSLSVSFKNSIGCAEIINDRKLKKLGNILSFNIYDKFTMSYPFIENLKGKLFMFYGSQRSEKFSPMKHELCLATSSDLFNWKTSNQILLKRRKKELGFARPWIFYIKKKKFMLVGSSEENRYKIILFEFFNSKWKRINNNVIKNLSNWDNLETEYPSHIKVNNQNYIFYNGNFHGKTGFGYCKVEE